MLKSVVRAAAAAFRLPTATTSTARALPLSCPTLYAPSRATARPFTRSLWMMSGSGASGYRPKLFTSKVLNPSASCGCGGLHTEGDKAFGQFLFDEIKEEKKIQKSETLPKMSGGWQLTLDGTEAQLTKHAAAEKITVTFNVNNSILPNFAEEADEGQQKSGEEVEILSTPNFVVEVTKQAAKHSLVIDCQFLQDEVPHTHATYIVNRMHGGSTSNLSCCFQMGHGEGEESDIFGICEVSFQPEGDEDWKETSYTLTKDSLNDDLYDHMMDFLADRGVDNTFADELMELSTAIEHQEYIKFLEDLKSFVKCN
ncbi:complement component 1 Q subcomponent-binding protein, mitochondrial isoform X1 [Dunckerocampus dactyliophorus]|uniref:complement component 1 Q subcomponent-binding protein, mitochondrial isoform X1 n=1 Tax=Dunckerocampus dactyliophorus TaxID=161453 RepID=UPI00240549D9|nr:complement component 1 Q subcomponent-binding protein, mitochondrial isoform X1 [Dunckerocampus dactyliophorus]